MSKVLLGFLPPDLPRVCCVIWFLLTSPFVWSFFDFLKSVSGILLLYLYATFLYDLYFLVAEESRGDVVLFVGDFFLCMEGCGFNLAFSVGLCASSSGVGEVLFSVGRLPCRKSGTFPLVLSIFSEPSSIDVCDRVLKSGSCGSAVIRMGVVPAL